MKNMIKIFTILFVACVFIGAARPKGKSFSMSFTEKNWMDEAIEGEFIKFEKKGISQKRVDVTYKAFIDKSKDRLNSFRGCVKRYKVIDQKVYGDETTVKHLLEVMCEKYNVPDVDFLYYHQDELDAKHPIISKKFKKAPILVPAKKKDFHKVVLFVDWYYDIIYSSRMKIKNRACQKISDLSK